jgi:(E)-4-hydroxy-3-methylbut-2-enyl-diphosphate synthase
MHETEQGWMAPRRPTRQVRLGKVAVGGGAPVSVQTMTKTDTRDSAATLAQIRELETWGCDVVRLAVPDEAAARALRDICPQVRLPVVADIHFEHRLALAALEAGAAGLRINPGNIGGPDKVREVVRAAQERRIPIRVGVNAGSLEKDILERHGSATAEALVESALGHVRLLEDAGFSDIKISVKASDVSRTVRAYRLLAARCHYPLHLGVTEAGTLLAGSVRSSVALGLLLAEGIGDTIRVSLTEPPAQEVRVGLDILRALGLRPPGASVISCPTCGRVQVDVIRLAHEVEAGLEVLYRQQPEGPRPTVAVMGCVVNGPGEAREADLAVAGGKGRGALYAGGRLVRSVDENEIVPALLDLVREWLAGR